MYKCSLCVLQGGSGLPWYLSVMSMRACGRHTQMVWTEHHLGMKDA